MLGLEDPMKPPAASRQLLRPLRERSQLAARIENADQIRAIAGPGDLREQILLS